MIKLENAWTKSFENPSENMSFHETSFIINANIYWRFSYAGIWELVNLFVRTKNFNYHICYENSPKT